MATRVGCGCVIRAGWTSASKKALRSLLEQVGLLADVVSSLVDGKTGNRSRGNCCSFQRLPQTAESLARPRRNFANWLPHQNPHFHVTNIDRKTVRTRAGNEWNFSRNVCFSVGFSHPSSCIGPIIFVLPSRSAGVACLCRLVQTSVQICIKD